MCVSRYMCIGLCVCVCVWCICTTKRHSNTAQAPCRAWHTKVRKGKT